MSLNIFEIWDSIGRKTPFAVRRDNWTEEYYTIVESVDCEELPYGRAFGYSTSKGIRSDHYSYDRKWREEGLIPCCGCYQWTLVDDSVLAKYKERLKATKQSIKAAYTITSQFYFGKYKGKTVEDVFYENPAYIEWTISNLDKFFLTPDAFNYLNKLKPDFQFKDSTITLNTAKVDKLST